MKISGAYRNRHGEPLDFYWKWMELIEANTDRCIAKMLARSKPVVLAQTEIHIPDDPEFYASFFWE